MEAQLTGNIKAQRQNRRLGLPLRSGTGTRLCLVAGILLLASGCDRGTHPGLIDKPAPVFALNDGRESVDLAKLRGRVVVLNFWATWCAPCIEELPALEQMQRQLPQVLVVSVASDEDFTDYQTYLERRPVSLMSVYDEKQTSNALYGSFRFPETYIIDKQGIVRRKLVGPQEFASPDMLDYLRKLAA
jgi:cytochrome c biogenesis protein CcmG/thiol:disulfide interchange protein DsbE